PPCAHGRTAVRAREGCRTHTAGWPCAHGSVAVCAWQAGRMSMAALPCAHGGVSVRTRVGGVCERAVGIRRREAAVFTSYDAVLMRLGGVPVRMGDEFERRAA